MNPDYVYRTRIFIGLSLSQVVYILDQVRAFEEELLLRIKQQGLTVKPRILVVRQTVNSHEFFD